MTAFDLLKRPWIIVLFWVALVVGCGDDGHDGADAADEDGGSMSDDAGDSDAGRDGSVRDDAGDGSVRDDAGDSDAGDSDAGDGGEDDSMSIPRPGSRLSLRGLAAGDQFALETIYDQELQQECSYLETSERGAATPSYHCVPNEFTEERYSDAECTQEVVRWSARSASACRSSTAPSIVRAARVLPCGSLRIVAQQLDLEAPLALTTIYRRANGTGLCEEEAVNDATIYATVPGVLDALVEARVEVTSSAEPGLEVEVYVGEDGSRVLAGMRWDDGERCTPQVLDRNGTSLPCLPTRALSATQNVYVDDACSEPVFTSTFTPGCTQEPPFSWGMMFGEIDGCQYPSALFHLGDEIPTGFSGEPGACELFDSAPDTWRMFAAGQERSLADVPMATLVHQGSGRLQLQHYAAQDGTPIAATSEWRDAEGEHACSPRMFADGTLRCVQAEYFSSDGLFADAACTVPAYASFVGGCNPEADAPRIRADSELSDELCATVVTKLVRLQRHSGAVYRDLEGCMEVALEAGQASFIDGEELDVTELPELQRTMR